MGNKVKYNLKNVYAAKLTETVKDGVTTFTYDTPKPIPGAVSISLDAEGETKAFYADGIVYFRSVTNNGYSGDIEIALIPEWFRMDILQEVLDDKGVLVEKSGLSDTVKFALLFEFDGDIRSIRHVLYYCTASRPSLESETKEDTIEPSTEKLSITADPRSDGLVKARSGDATDATAYDKAYKWLYDAIGQIKDGASTADVAAVWPTAQEIGFNNEEEAFMLQFAHGIGLGLWEKPVISRLFSIDKPFTLREGVTFAIETWCPSEDGSGSARIEEEVVVRKDGAELITKFPSKEMTSCGLPGCQFL